MSRLRTLLICLIAGAVVSAALPAQAQTPTFRLWSNDLKGGSMPMEHTSNSLGCTGSNVSPHLAWSGAPQGTRSFVITVYDPDAPTGSGFWHWIVANIPASVTMIGSNASRTPRMPSGSIETRTDFGVPGYGGPCPPAGDQPHRYIFTIHALSVDRLDVNADMSGAMVGFMTNANRIASASFTVRYGR
jgi:Raf kinase inhibitor-like YbhB/YbcL family protein